MRKICIMLLLFIISLTEVQAYALKLYDEYGNRVGTYRKEGDTYQLYDFYDNKVDTPESLIKNAPSQKTLSEYSQMFYDEHMLPIGVWRSTGYYGNDGKYYPRGFYYPSSWTRTRSPYIVRPRVYNGNQSDFFKYADYKNNVNYVDTRYPKLHKFRH